ncbi:MAG: hypothetical protein NTW26_00760 [bacterium]|nr:hypothetical protein [bacterium]
MKDITYAASLVADEPLDGERYFAGLTGLRAWMDSAGAPFPGYRRLYTLFTPRGAAGFRVHPDLYVRLRRRLYPLYTWLRVELGPDFKALQVRTGMASHTGADAGWGAILWAAVGRAFIYIFPAWLALYIFKPWLVSLALGIVCFVVAGLGFLFFEYTLVRAALTVRGIEFRAELVRLHDGAVSRVTQELGLDLLASRQITGPGIEPEIPRRRTVDDVEKRTGEMPPPTD